MFPLQPPLTQTQKMGCSLPSAQALSLPQAGCVLLGLIPDEEGVFPSQTLWCRSNELVQALLWTQAGLGTTSPTHFQGTFDMQREKLVF